MQTTKPSKKPIRYLSEDATYWQSHADSLKASGLSRINYCRQHNVNYDRFAYWLSKQPRQTSSLVAVKLKTTSESLTESFTGDVLCTLSLRNGNYLKIHDIRVLSLILEKLN